MQREGEVVHLVAHEIIDLSADLARIGDRSGSMQIHEGRDDEVRIGGPRPIAETDRPSCATSIFPIYILTGLR
ncbi:hypothetical protein JP75_20440 [Devosia riboflavina]|uniref:Uncharacterized protein n=1 Tax=Devosia riboflavina TaxID=46914 RepID=A0A087LY39_9HYPH|nr:hypothetical protein JP75_20440 [Devosia riboflavina]